MTGKVEIGISLISHTNIGKTTLARTLLKRDIGEVQDRDHVTMETTGYVMAETGDSVLRIYDTPGFGGSHAADLLERLKAEGTAGGWFKHHVVDRITNRALFSSLEAARAVRRHADVVYYLVNAREQPRDAGYTRDELALLQELGVPVVIVINQVEQPGTSNQYAEYLRSIEKGWREFSASYQIVRGVAVLDAFSRFWLQELNLLETTVSALAGKKSEILGKLLAIYKNEQNETVKRCSEYAASTLVFALKQSVERKGRPDKEVFNELFAPLQAKMDEYIEQLMIAWSLEASNSPALEADLSQVKGLVLKKLPEAGVGILSAALAGAGGGLAADAMAGGLTFGGGAIIGFLLGGLGGLVAARGFNYLVGAGRCRWSDDFITAFFRQLVFTFLLIAHHGRGRGLIDFNRRVEVWNDALDSAMSKEKVQFVRAVAMFRSENTPRFAERAISEVFENTVHDVLVTLYPGPGNQQSI
jgi:predicted GTPase